MLPRYYSFVYLLFPDFCLGSLCKAQRERQLPCDLMLKSVE